MAIDPLIAYGVRPPQVEDASTYRARAISLRNLDREQLVREEQLKQAKMATAQQSQGVADDQALRGVFSSSVDAAGNLDEGKALAGAFKVSPKAGLSLQQQFLEKRKTALDQSLEEMKVNSAKASRIGSIAGSMADQNTYQTGIMAALQEGLIPPQEAAQYLARPWNAETQAQIKQLQQQALSAKDMADIRFKEIEEKRKSTEDALTLPGKAADARVKVAEAEQVAQFGMTRKDKEILDNHRETMKLADRRASVAESQGAERIAMDRARLRQEGGSPDLVKAVIENPTLYDGLTPSARTAIAPELARQGFNGFGKQLSESAITKISDSRSGVTSLKDLRQTLIKNEKYIGPISGLEAMIPWATDAKNAESEINLVRQRVGKALEGGVLRKEDEEKYKKILATLRDTPKTAIFKVDNLIRTIESDLDTYVEEQRRAGRKVNTPAAADAKAVTTPSSSSSVQKWGRDKNGNPVKL